MSYDSIALTNLYGIDTLNTFSWIGFSREEFKQLLILFDHLVNNKCFEKINHSYPFIFNYSTDVTEMDIVSVLQKDGVPILLDIESKNGDDSLRS